MSTVLNDENLQPNATLALSGTEYLLSGEAVLAGTVLGGGTLSVDPSATAVVDNATFEDAAVFDVFGTVEQFFFVQYGTTSTDPVSVTIAPGGVYTLINDVARDTVEPSGDADATITNLGLLQVVGAIDTLQAINVDLVNTGTLAVGGAAVSLNGPANTLGGTITGSGMLELAGNGLSTLAAGVVVNVGTLAIESGAVSVGADLNYAGALMISNPGTLSLGGETLTSTGTATLGGVLDGEGTLRLDGQAAVTTSDFYVFAGAALEVAGTLTEENSFYLGNGTADTASIVIDAGGTFDSVNDSTIQTSGTQSIINDGLFEKTATPGTGGINALSQSNFINQGLVSAQTGTLLFGGTLTNDGTVVATGAAVEVGGPLTQALGERGTFEIGTAGQVAISGSVDAAQTISFTGTSSALVLADPAAFAGVIEGFAAGDTIDLSGIAANGLSYAGGVLTISETTDDILQHTYTLVAPGIADAAALALVYDNAGGTEIVLNHLGPQFTNPSGTIIADTWTADGSGLWTSGGNWYQVVPTPNGNQTLTVPPIFSNDAEIEPISGTAAFALTYDDTDTVNRLDGSAAATLDLTGGTLQVNAGGAWYGDFFNIGGTLDAVTGWAASGNTGLSADATDEVDSGTFAVGGGTLAGTVIGQGEFGLIGSDGYTYTIEPGFSITSGTFALEAQGAFGATVTLDTDLSYAGNFITVDPESAAGPVLLLNGNTLTLTGEADLAFGTIAGGGAMILAGVATETELDLQDSVTVSVTGTLSLKGFLTLGDGAASDTSTLNIAAGGTAEFVDYIGAFVSGIDEDLGGVRGTIDNAGLLEKTGDSGESIIQINAFDDTGVITVDTGGLDIAAASATIAGLVSGPGQLDLDIYGATANSTLAAGTTLDTASLGTGGTITLDTSLSYAGSYDIGQSFFPILQLNGQSFTTTGSGELNGNIAGPGTFDVAGFADTASGITVSGAAVLLVSGTLAQNNYGLAIGSSPTDTASLVIASSGTFELLADSATTIGADATIDNAGLLDVAESPTGSSINNGAVRNTGTVLVQNGTLELNSTIIGSGTMVIAAQAELSLSGSVDAGQTLGFAGPGTLSLADVSEAVQNFLGTIEGFGGGDTIDLPDIARSLVNSISYDAASGVLDINVGNPTDIHITIAGAAGFAIESDSNGDTEVVACYLHGTRIATARGERNVEDLRVGERVITRSGDAQASVARQVKWIGHRHIDCQRHPQPRDVWPVRISAHAFAANQPHRTLWLSPEHAVFVDGLLIPIKCLINGATIVQEPRDEVDYWHVELERHDVIFAEGLPCESYLDTNNRWAFANGGVVQLRPVFAPDQNCEAIWEAAGCAPLRITGQAVARVATRLQRQARNLGYATRREVDAIPQRNARNTTNLATILRPDWYLSANPDVAAACIDPATHYAGWGRGEGRLPCPEADLVRALGLVDPLMVAITMPDVIASGVDPVEHFCVTGWRERRRPNPYFETGWYHDTFDLPDGTNPLLHYVLFGEAQGLRPSRHFDPAWYRRRYRLASSVSPLAHYLKHRRTQRFSPLQTFDLDVYKAQQAATLLPNRDPYAHYVALGRFAAAEVVPSERAAA